MEVGSTTFRVTCRRNGNKDKIMQPTHSPLIMATLKSVSFNVSKYARRLVNVWGVRHMIIVIESD